MQLTDLTPTSPIPAANPLDVEFIYHSYQQAKKLHGSYSLGLEDEQAMNRLLKDPANHVAASIRAGMLCGMAEDNLLSDWQTKTGLNRLVFERAASFPMEQGVALFHPENLLEYLARQS